MDWEERTAFSGGSKVGSKAGSCWELPSKTVSVRRSVLGSCRWFGKFAQGTDIRCTASVDHGILRSGNSEWFLLGRVPRGCFISDSTNEGVKWPNALVAIDGVPQLDSKSTVRAMACPQKLHSCALIRECFRLFVPIVTISSSPQSWHWVSLASNLGVLQLDRAWTDISLQQMGSETVACQRPALKDRWFSFSFL